MMQPLFTRTGCIKILWIAVIGLAILPLTPGFKQQRNMHLAEAYAAKLRPTLRADKRFDQIKLMSYTAMGGSLSVRGSVQDDRAKEELRQLVMAAHPPTNISFTINVTGHEREPGSAVDGADGHSATH